MIIDTGKDLGTLKRENRTAAFTEFYTLFFPRLLLTAHKYVKDTTVAEEIVQNVFLKIWENAESLEEIQNLKPYLYKSVINLSINYLNRQRTIEHHHHQLASDLTEAYVIDLDEENELVVLLNQEIEKLPPQCRKIFRLNRFERLKYKEIAVMLEISEKTVENHIAYALKILRKSMLEKRPGYTPRQRKLIVWFFLQ